ARDRAYRERVRAHGALLQHRSQPCRLAYRALGVEFGGDVRAADEVHRHAECNQFVREGAVGFLPRTDDHVVHAECLRLAVGRDVQTGVVDLFIGDAAEHFHALGLQCRAMHPAGGLVEAFARPAGRALQQPYLAGRGLWIGFFEAAATFQRGIDAPFARPARDVGGGRGRILRQEFGDVETDAAGTDDRDALAEVPVAGDGIAVTHHHWVILPRNARVARRHAGGDDHRVEIALLQDCRIGAFAEAHVDAKFIQQVAPVAHRLCVLLFAGNAFGEVELTTDFVRLFIQRDSVAALRERGRASKPRRARADYREALLLHDGCIDELGFEAGARVHQARCALVLEYMVEAGLVAGDAG